MSRAAQITHVLLRIVAGFLFMQHGGQKLLGWFPSPEMGGSLPPLVMAAGVLELAGGALVLVGLFTRPVAFVLSGEMAVAYFMAHFPQAALPIQNRGEPAALFAFIFLFLAANGSGGFSLDVLLRRSHARAALGEPRPAPAA